jgi:hypothetical protein
VQPAKRPPTTLPDTPSPDVARLTQTLDRNGRCNGAVLFFVSQAVVAPADVSIFYRNGAMLVSYREFGDFVPSS